MSERYPDITAEEIAHHYRSAMDSVTIINQVIANPEEYKNDETILSRNINHLNVMLDMDYWTTEDLTPFQNAVAVDTSAFDTLVSG